MVALQRAGIPLPACAALLSPWVDLEATGETMTSKAAEDPMVQKQILQQLAGMYLPQGNLREPLASPLYADLCGLPPLLIQVGSRETLLDDAVRISAHARRAGVTVELEVCDRLTHVFQVFCTRLDEARAALERLGRFIERHTG
jgi:acetyl esterase/lipase